MPTRLLTAEALERVRLAAQAARDLDSADRMILDYAYMSAAFDAEIPADTRRRVSADPTAQAYSAIVTRRWAVSDATPLRIGTVSSAAAQSMIAAPGPRPDPANR